MARPRWLLFLDDPQDLVLRRLFELATLVQGYRMLQSCRVAEVVAALDFGLPATLAEKTAPSNRFF